MDKPLVSIITPSLNQGRWLEKTIESVLGQTYPNIEYIVIDGGSKDGSVEIIEKYQNRIAYWQSKADKGQADAINIGIKKAKGVLIAYLNADDLLEPTAVEGIVNAYEVNQDFSIYYGRCKTIDQDGKLIKEGQGDQLKHHQLLSTGMLPGIYQPACFFNDKYLDKEKLFDINYKYAFDYEMLLRITLDTSMLFLNRDVASYRVHNESKSSLHRIEAYKEKLQIQEKYSKAGFFKVKWKQLKLSIAEKTGKITNGNAAL